MDVLYTKNKSCRLLQELGGYTLGQADNVRRIMSKKTARQNDA